MTYISDHRHHLRRNLPGRLPGLHVNRFYAGVPIAEATLIAGCVLLFTRRVHLEKVMNQIDWLFSLLAPFRNRGAVGLSTITAILSNLVWNLPAVRLLRSSVEQISTPTAGWLTLAAVSTLAGNLTLPGSVANLIVAEIAGRNGVKFSFQEYTRSGIIITVLSLLIGILWIQVFIWK